MRIDDARNEALLLLSGKTLSVIVPVYNEQSFIAATLTRIKQSGIPCELVVVDDGSTDDTRAILRGYAEGKKITWRDGISAIRCVVLYNLLRR